MAVFTHNIDTYIREMINSKASAILHLKNEAVDKILNPVLLSTIYTFSK